MTRLFIAMVFGAGCVAGAIAMCGALLVMEGKE
jgi:hypothetical protein